LDTPPVCSSQGIATSGDNPCGKFQLDVFKAVCEFERNLICDRANASLAAARAKGVRLGRPTSLHKRAGEVLALKKQGMGLRAISRELGMAMSSVHSVLAAKKAKRSSS
jgi:DNA invertase Pin-like site-specific DNA recombinase